MSEYTDYGYTNADADHTFWYLIRPLMQLLNKDMLILDLGCGNGYIANYLIAQGYRVYGTDASEKGITIANNTNPGHFFVQDLADKRLPEGIRDMQFDTVISTEVIEHLYDPQTFIDTCRQILSGTHGQLIISTPYHGYLKNLLLAVFNKWDSHIDPLWRGGHIKMWSKNTLSKLLTSNGFEIQSFKGCGGRPLIWRSMMIKAQLK